jgi:hypothetical protein
MSRSIPVRWPLEGQITQLFGENPNDYVQYGYPGHNGLDLATAHRQPCKPMAEGYVEKLIAEAGGYGYGVTLMHDGGVRSYYAHADKTLVKVKQTAYFDTDLMLCDSSGNSTGDHLHLGWRAPAGAADYSAAWKGYVNPLPILRAGAYSVNGSAPPEPAKPFVMPVIPELPHYMVVTLVKKWLNLRDIPSAAGRDLGDLYPGTRVSVFGVATVRNDVWFMVKTDGGLIGYVAAFYDGTAWMEPAV